MPAEVLVGCGEAGLLTVEAGRVDAGPPTVVPGSADPAFVSVAGVCVDAWFESASAGVELVVSGAGVVGTVLTSPVVASAVRVAASELTADPAPA